MWCGGDRGRGGDRGCGGDWGRVGDRGLCVDRGLEFCLLAECAHFRLSIFE